MMYLIGKDITQSRIATKIKIKWNLNMIMTFSLVTLFAVLFLLTLQAVLTSSNIACWLVQNEGEDKEEGKFECTCSMRRFRLYEYINSPYIQIFLIQVTKNKLSTRNYPLSQFSIETTCFLHSELMSNIFVAIQSLDSTFLYECNKISISSINFEFQIKKMLTAQQKAEAANHLKNISAEAQLEEQIKSTYKKNSKGIRDLIQSLKESPNQQMGLLKQLNGAAGKLLLELETKNRFLLAVQQNMKNHKEKLNKDKIRAFDQKERIQASIEQIKETIKKIRQTVEDSIKQQGEKRVKIQADLQKSLDQIREKIKTFRQQSIKMHQQNTPLQQKVTQVKTKMQGLEGQFKKKAQQKDQQVKVEKQELMQKLKLLQQQVNKVTEMNREYSATEKKNFDKKLSIHLRTQKFPEYSTSFQSSANTINQCKQELFKGVQRLNQAKQNAIKFNSEASQLNDQFLQELKKQNEKQQKIAILKAQKDEVRTRILELQNKLKQKNQNKQ